MKPLLLKILYLHQTSQKYYFGLIANNGVPNDLVFLHETILKLIIEILAVLVPKSNPKKKLILNKYLRKVF